ncbi:MAG: ASCH domain-containing protein [Anaerolineae bacterium]|nr:ASCH domain-containing protein [Anaerolineae bacterium]
MKALSFRQPRAEQIVRGEKTVDIRTWHVHYRGPLAVHASTKRRDGRCRALGFDPRALDYGALIGKVELIDIVPLDEATYESLRAEHLLDTSFPGPPCYAWRLAKPQRFETPVPCRGRRGLFDAEVGEDALLSNVPDRRARRVSYRVTPLPEPDPQHPFVLYTIPENGAGDLNRGYRVALYQWLRRNGDTERRAPGAMWEIELGGDPLRAIADHLLSALRANGYKATDLARAAGSEKPFYLDELTGLRLALILLAVKPLMRHDRIEAIGQGVQAMGDEEAYYWFSKCSAGPEAVRAQRALRVLLAGE